MAKPRQKIGTIPCPCCGKVVPLAQQSSGFAMVVCSWCDTKTQTFSAAGDAELRRKAKLAPVAAQDQQKEGGEKSPDKSAGDWLTGILGA